MTPKVKRYFTMIGLVAGTVVSVAGALAVFDVTIPRPVFASELITVQQQVLRLESVITSQQLSDRRLRLYQNEREQREWEELDGYVPDFLLNEKVELERIIDDLEHKLKTIRNQAIDN